MPACDSWLYAKRSSTTKRARDEGRIDYNFCHVHRTLRLTPAMEAGITVTSGGVEVTLLP